MRFIRSSIIFFLGVFLLAFVGYGHSFAFDQVVIWGHKLHSHTHSYIHNAFYKAFTHLGYKTYWFDSTDHVEDFDFANTLFLTEGQVDENLPLREDGFYILHNCDYQKYQSLRNKKRTINIQVYTDDVLNWPDLVKMDLCTYCDFEGRTIYLTWASDLLPEEIEKNKFAVFNTQQKHRVMWVGTYGGSLFGNDTELTPFIKEAEKHKFQFLIKHQISDELNCQFVQQSQLAPAIVGKWQKEKGYIPCRIFKNISYGQMGVTNSARINELFEGKLIYDPDPAQLFHKALNFIKKRDKEPIFELMNIVKEHHTYLNRIETILNFISLLNEKNN